MDGRQLLLPICHPSGRKPFSLVLRRLQILAGLVARHRASPTRLARAPPYLKAAVSSAYLSKKLTRPLATKDGGTLRTILDVRAYILRLSKDRERSAQWQRAAQLLLEHADVAALSRQVELALVYDGKIDVTKT